MSGRAGQASGRWCAESQRDERGAVAIEVVLLVPVLVMVLCVITGGWRLWSARTEVADAAGAAARAATLETSGSQGRARAEQVAAADLDALGVQCEPRSVDVDTAGFATEPGVPAEVRVRVSCTVQLADLFAPGLPGSWQVSASRAHQMDTFRDRRP